MLHDGSQHNALSCNDLVLDFIGARIVRINKRKGTEVHPVRFGRFHEFTVDIGNQGVAKVKDSLEVFQLSDLVEFLQSRSRTAVIPVERCQDRKTQPSCHEVFRTVRAKSADVGTGIEESAHIQRGKLLQRQKKMSPPGLVVPGPHTSIAMHTDITRAGEE